MTTHRLPTTDLNETFSGSDTFNNQLIVGGGPNINLNTFQLLPSGGQNTTRLYFGTGGPSSGSWTNWKMSVQDNFSNTFEIDNGTTNADPTASTYTNVFKLTNTGALSIPNQFLGPSNLGAATPVYSFTGAANYGMDFRSGVGPVIVFNGVDTFGIINGGIRLTSASVFQFTNGAMNGTADASISRNGPASINFGNGTAGNFSATLVCGNILLTSAAPTVGASQASLGSTTATSATAGANGAVPAQVAGYLIINVAGTTQKIPYFNN